MENTFFMQGSQTFSHLNKNGPNFRLWKSSPILLMLHDSLVQITTVCVFHDQTKRRCCVLKEYLSIANNVRMSNRVLIAVKMITEWKRVF